MPNGETAAESFATLLATTTDLQGFIAWLEKGDNGIAEVFGSDEELSLRWDTLNGSVN